jgi:uncharacterized membrane protein
MSVKKISNSIVEKNWNQLSKAERQEIAELMEHVDDLRDVNQEYVDYRTFGQRAADAVAKVAGSWSFIIIFLSSLLMWAFLNTEILGPRQEAFDPYPYFFFKSGFIDVSCCTSANYYDVTKSSRCER